MQIPSHSDAPPWASWLIERNSTIQTARHEIFTTQRDSQSRITVPVLEGERSRDAVADPSSRVPLADDSLPILIEEPEDGGQR